MFFFNFYFYLPTSFIFLYVGRRLIVVFCPAATTSPSLHCISILTRVLEIYIFSFPFSAYTQLLNFFSLEICVEKLFLCGIVHFVWFEICVGGHLILE